MGVRGIRKPSLLILAAIVMIGASSCIGNRNLNTNYETSDRISGTNGVSLDDRIMEYINERYDDKFIFNGQNIYNSMEKEIFVRSEKFPDDSINVGHTKVDGVGVFATIIFFYV